jgi:hypothetical protein
MRILLINQAFVSPDEPGHTRHIEMAKLLQSRGHEKVIVASDLHQWDTRTKVCLKKPHSGGLEIVSVREGDICLGYTFGIARRRLPAVRVDPNRNERGDLYAVAANFADEVGEERQRRHYLDPGLIIGAVASTADSEERNNANGNCGE